MRGWKVLVIWPVFGLGTPVPAVILLIGTVPPVPTASEVVP
jgi:hypothetical protein